MIDRLAFAYAFTYFACSRFEIDARVLIYNRNLGYRLVGRDMNRALRTEEKLPWLVIMLPGGLHFDIFSGAYERTSAASDTIPGGYFRRRLFHTVLFSQFSDDSHIGAAGQKALQNGFSILSDRISVGIYLCAFVGGVNTCRD